MSDERAVRLSADHVGESAAAIDPEFPSAGPRYALRHLGRFRRSLLPRFYETCFYETLARGPPAIHTTIALKRNDFELDRHFALVYCLSMVFSESRYPLFGIML